MQTCTCIYMHCRHKWFRDHYEQVFWFGWWCPLMHSVPCSDTALTCARCWGCWDPYQWSPLYPSLLSSPETHFLLSGSCGWCFEHVGNPLPANKKRRGREGREGGRKRNGGKGGEREGEGRGGERSDYTLTDHILWWQYLSPVQSVVRCGPLCRWDSTLTTGEGSCRWWVLCRSCEGTQHELILGHAINICITIDTCTLYTVYVTGRFTLWQWQSWVEWDMPPWTRPGFHALSSSNLTPTQD